jgi:preprotein translocase subunit YajC
MSHSFASLFLMAQPGGGGSSTLLIGYLGIMFVVFYFFMIRPQSQKAKKQKTFFSNLQKGDKVVTIAGIHGTVNKVNDDNTTLQIEVSPGSYLKIEKSAISMDWTAALQKASAPAETSK